MAKAPVENTITNLTKMKEEAYKIILEHKTQKEKELNAKKEAKNTSPKGIFSKPKPTEESIQRTTDKIKALEILFLAVHKSDSVEELYEEVLKAKNDVKGTHAGEGTTISTTCKEIISKMKSMANETEQKAMGQVDLDIVDSALTHGLG